MSSTPSRIAWATQQGSVSIKKKKEEERTQKHTHSNMPQWLFKNCLVLVYDGEGVPMHVAHVELAGQLSSVSSLLSPLDGSQGSSSVYQACTESTLYPVTHPANPQEIFAGCSRGWGWGYQMNPNLKMGHKTINSYQRRSENTTVVMCYLLRTAEIAAAWINKGACCQAWQLEFNPWDPLGKMKNNWFLQIV